MSDHESPLAQCNQGQSEYDEFRPVDRLTEAEIESLRQNQKEALAYAQKAFFPNARIHRADVDPKGEPKQ